MPRSGLGSTPGLAWGSDGFKGLQAFSRCQYVKLSRFQGFKGLQEGFFGPLLARHVLCIDGIHAIFHLALALDQATKAREVIRLGFVLAPGLGLGEGGDRSASLLQGVVDVVLVPTRGSFGVASVFKKPRR